jgi:hypothetical protein
MQHPKLARKRNKAAATAPEISGDGPNGPSSSPIKVVPAAPAPPLSPFDKTVSDLLTPGMSDIEKLQKLKELILADQHPFFTSAPKVAHLLSLRVSASGSNASNSGGELDAEPLSLLANQYNNIPLAERLSSPKAQANGDFHASNDSASNLVSSHEEASFGRHIQGLNDVANAESTKREEDVDMSESYRFEPTETGAGSIHPEPHLGPVPQSYQRHSDVQRGNERPGFDDSGRRSPREDSRGWSKGNDGRVPFNDHQSRFPPGNNSRYGDVGGRYGTSYYRGGYRNQGNRRYSLNDRPNSDQRNYDNARDYDRQPDFSPSYSDERRLDDRYNDKGLATGPRGQAYYNGARSTYGRRIDDSMVPGSPQEPVQPLKSGSMEASKPDENMQLGLKEDFNATSATNSEAPLVVDLKAEAESPVSLGNGLPPSTADSIVPPTASPDRIDVAMDSHSLKGHEETDKSKANRSPTPNADNRETKSLDTDHEPRPNYMPRDGHRFPPYDRPRPNTYQKYPVGNRNYDRPLPVRDDRPYPNREPYRPAYRPSSPPLADDRRFVPRDAGYAHEPGYLSPRREYRSGDWDMKRDDRPLERPYDRNRDLDRDRRVPAPLPPKVSVAGGPRQRYPPLPEHAGPRGNPNNRAIHDPYSIPPPHDPRGYDRDPYADPLPPVPGAYSRDASRVRPRSLSPPRRDYRPDDRPNKRLRGPDPSYGPPPVTGELPLFSSGRCHFHILLLLGHYATPGYGTTRAHDYQPDRRPIPAAPSQAAYYRPDDRAPARY